MLITEIEYALSMMSAATVREIHRRVDALVPGTRMEDVLADLQALRESGLIECSTGPLCRESVCSRVKPPKQESVLLLPLEHIADSLRYCLPVLERIDDALQSCATSLEHLSHCLGFEASRRGERGLK